MGKPCQWPNIPVPSIPKCDGPNNKNKQRGVELLPQSEHLNEDHMELPRHTVSGNPMPLPFFLPSPTLLLSLPCFSVSHSYVHLWIYSMNKTSGNCFLKVEVCYFLLLKTFSSLIYRDNSKFASTLKSVNTGSVALWKHCYVCLNVLTIPTSPATAAQPMAWVWGIA